MAEADAASRASRLNAEVPDEWRGFAFEGAAFGCALLDGLTPWRARRWADFTAGPAAPHVYMAHVGYGLALAELPWGQRRAVETVSRLPDPLLRWLALDGFGFQRGYFYRRYCDTVRSVSNPFTGLTARVFDQGLGRSLWFVAGADVDHLADLVASWGESRRGDLWAGAGLAAAYAGGADETALGRLVALSGPYAHELAQGVAFAAQARRRAGNPAPHTERACARVWGRSAEYAAGQTDDALSGLTLDGTASAYDTWRARIRDRHLAAAYVEAR